MREKLEQTKEFIEEFELMRRSTGQWVFTALLTVRNNKRNFPLLHNWLLNQLTDDEINQNQLTFAKIWAGEIELVEKQDRYVIYQFDKRGDVWLLFQYGFGVVSVSAPLSKTTKANEHDMYRSSNAHFDQDFAFAMRDTGKFKIEKVVE